MDDKRIAEAEANLASALEVYKQLCTDEEWDFEFEVQEMIDNLV